MSGDEDLVGALRLQAQVCREFGSPFNGAMLLHMAADLEAGGPVGALLEPWRGASRRTLFDDAVPIRLVNAFTHLAMGDEAPALARLYPREGRPGDADAAWAVARDLIGPQYAHLAAFMGHEPQTNEVRRSGVLLGGFLTIAEETGLPLRTFEVGASAGLNLFWDRFRYDLGAAAWGDPVAPVVVPVDWSGPLPPLHARPQVAERAACDRRPTDLADPAQRRRLLACVWPDQLDRGQRGLSSALSVIRGSCRDFAELQGKSLLVREAECVLIPDDFQRWVDCQEFSRLIRQADQAEDAEARSALLQRAVSLYAGPFLEGCFFDWALQLQGEYETLALQAMLQLSGLELEQRRWLSALQTA